MKNSYIFETKTISGKSDTVLHFLNLYNAWNNRGNWILLSDSTVNLSQYIFLVEVYEENWASQRYTSGKNPQRISGIPGILRLCFGNHCF